MWHSKIVFEKALWQEKYIIDALKKIDGLQLEINKTKFVSILLEAKENDADVKRKVLKVLENILIVQKKFDFLLAGIEVKKITPSLNLLLSLLLNYDIEYEKSIINGVLIKQKEFCLDGIFNFKMQKLVKEWQEMVYITKLLLSEESTEQDLCEFIAFIIEARPKKEDVLVLSKKENTFTLTNIFKGAECEIACLYENNEFNIVNSIIENYPKKVLVEGKILSEDILQLVSKIVCFKIL
ncbi:MAG: hypothetical protein RR123_04415 [Clostridia bacterium]